MLLILKLTILFSRSHVKDYPTNLRHKNPFCRLFILKMTLFLTCSHVTDRPASSRQRRSSSTSMVSFFSELRVRS